MDNNTNEVKLYAVETRADYEGVVDLWVFTSLQDAESKFNEVASWSATEYPEYRSNDVRLLGPLELGQNVLDFEAGPVVREAQIGA
jgi:hypothetical protein